MQPSASASRKADNYAIFRLHDFRLYLTGRLVAVFGQQMLTGAVGWELYQRTHSPFALGMVGLVEMIGMVCCTLPAGHLADNYNRKRIILTALAVNCAATLGLTAVSWQQAPIFWIYACLFAAAAGRTFLWPASSAFLTSLVPRDLYPRAVTWNSGTFHLASVVGPALGGAALALLQRHSVHPAAYIYAFSLLTAFTNFLCVRGVRATHKVKYPEPMSLRSFATGFRFVFTQRLILGMITLDMFAVLLGGATALLPVFAEDILHAGPGGLGLLQAALPLGSVICSLVLAHRPPLHQAGRALLWSVVIFGVATVLFGMLNAETFGQWITLPWRVWFWASFVTLFICGAADNISVVVRHTSVQLHTPDEKRGRVAAVNSLFIGTSNELGGFESGTVANLLGKAMGNTNAFGAIFSVVTGGIGTMLVAAAVAWFWPEIRNYGRLDGNTGKDVTE
jgi:MFS family permease